ncbi:hypothetical protein AOLI_G00214100 [Acnodon oligacanthus]
MIHPLMIAIVVVNTSMSVIFWTLLLANSFFKEYEDEPSKPKSSKVSPASTVYRAVMLHPLMIGIVTVNTLITVVEWTWMMNEAMKGEEPPENAVAPA